jgi:hypothetical protein
MALSSSWGTLHALSAFSNSKYPRWQRTQWSFGGGAKDAKNVVSAVRMAGVGGAVGAAEKGKGEGGTGQR